MDELRLNKVFAGFLCAGLLIMAGVQIAHVLVPDQQLAENSYVIEVPEATEVADAAPQDTGLSLFWHCWPRLMWRLVKSWPKNAQLAMCLKLAELIKWVRRYGVL